MHFQDSKINQFQSEVNEKVELIETRIKDTIMFEISGEMEKRRILEEHH